MNWPWYVFLARFDPGYLWTTLLKELFQQPFDAVTSETENIFEFIKDTSLCHSMQVVDEVIWSAGRGAGPRFNINMSSYQFRKSHCGYKAVVSSSYLHNGISYTGKMTSFSESGPWFLA